MRDIEDLVREHGELLAVLAAAYGGWEELGRRMGQELSHEQVGADPKGTSRPGPVSPLQRK